eukprot:2181922-Pleurochrysis_carterae.AAC.1
MHPSPDAGRRACPPILGALPPRPSGYSSPRQNATKGDGGWVRTARSLTRSVATPSCSRACALTRLRSRC